MDVNGIMQMISAVGFPAVMCLGMFYFLLKKDAKQTETLVDNTKALTELTSAINDMKQRMGDGKE